MATATPRRRAWTLMVYMAGDNGKVFSTQNGKLTLMDEMTTAGYADLLEMGSVGTTNAVAVTCLFDTNHNATYLVELRRGGRGLAGSRVRRLRGVNTGDPATLSAFISQSVRRFPADRYALVIWNHGTGWLDVDIYEAVRSLAPDRRWSPPLFRRTTAVLSGGGTRPIAFDDSSKDFLDAADLRCALADAAATTGVHLDLIGMDACLMAMIEGARELAPYADYFVSSQEVEPMDGWPYAAILRALNAQPQMNGRELAEQIVRDFAHNYAAATRGGDTVTQSAVDLARTAQTEALCRQLVDCIAAHADAFLRGMIRRLLARSPFLSERVLTFQDENYRDLGDFALKLAARARSELYEDIAAAAQALYDHLQARGPEAPIVQIAFGPKYGAATGLSVFLPPKLGNLLGIYRNLAFAQATGWDKLVAWLFDEFNASWPR